MCTRKRLVLVHVIYMYLVESRKKPVYQWFSPFFERQKTKSLEKVLKKGLTISSNVYKICVIIKKRYNRYY